MPNESGSDKTLKCLVQSEGVRRAIVDMTGKGGGRADADELGSRQL